MVCIKPWKFSTWEFVPTDPIELESVDFDAGIATLAHRGLGCVALTVLWEHAKPMLPGNVPA